MIDFYYRGVRCQERIKLPPTPRNMKYCERLKSEIERKIETGTFDYADYFPKSSKAKLFTSQRGATVNLKDYLSQFLQDIKPFVKAASWNSYRKIINNQLIPEFGHLTLTELKRAHVKEWMATKTVTAKTMSTLISPLRMALDAAVEDDLIELNPLAGWKLRRRGRAPKTDKIDPFSHEERQAILNALEGQGRNLVEFAFWTGLRTSELCALDWGDVDWVNGYIYVTRAMTQAAKGNAEEPKTEKGERRVKLLPPALEALNRQKAHTFLKHQEVFQNPRTGERWTGDQPIRKTLWTYALTRAGVRYRYPYQTRHTFASMCLMAGEDVRWVSEQLGHTSWAFTAKVYSRWIPDDAPDAGSKVAARWCGSGTDGEAKC